MKTYKILGILIGLFLILSVGCSKDTTDSSGSVESSVDSSVSDSLTTEQADSAEDSTLYKIGDTITSGDLVFTINGVREAKAEDMIVPPEDGNILYIVDVGIENKGKESKSIVSISMFMLGDSQDNVFDESSLSIKREKGKITGTLEPGKKMTGEIAYEIPKTAKDLLLGVSSNLFQNDVFTFILDR